MKIIIISVSVFFLSFSHLGTSNALVIYFSERTIPTGYGTNIDGVIIEPLSSESPSIEITPESNYKFNISLPNRELIPNAVVRPIANSTFRGSQIPPIEVYFTIDQESRYINLDIPLGVTAFSPKLIKKIYRENKGSLPLHKLIYYYLITDNFIDDRTNDERWEDGKFHPNDLRLLINYSDLLWTLNQKKSDLYVEPTSQLDNRIDQFETVYSYFKENSNQNKLLNRADNSLAHLTNLLGLKFYNIWVGTIDKEPKLHHIDRFVLTNKFLEKVEALNNTDQEIIYQALSLRKINILNEITNDLEKIAFKTCNNTKRSFSEFYTYDLEIKPFNEAQPTDYLDRIYSLLETAIDKTKNATYNNEIGKQEVIGTAQSNLIFLQQLKDDVENPICN